MIKNTILFLTLGFVGAFVLDYSLAKYEFESGGLRDSCLFRMNCNNFYFLALAE